LKDNADKELRRKEKRRWIERFEKERHGEEWL